MREPLYVTRPYLPPLEEFTSCLETIWASRTLTNGGPFHAKLEQALCEYLEVPHISLFTNGTIALVTALQALEVRGEVITTPYSFVATAHSLLWNGLAPVFVDVDPHTLNLDPDRIEAAITDRTTAILPVHVYGTPCDTSAIEAVARRHGLKVIYDAAHAFAVRREGRTILDCGDLSVLSFHATKVFNTFEGGAIVCRDPQMKRRIDELKNFGFVDETTVVAPGINGKMSEVNAAFGLVQLRHVDAVLARRAAIAALYRQLLSGQPGIHVPAPLPGVQANNSYFPVFITPDHPTGRDAVYFRLREHGIFGRRYFFPLISEFPMYRHLPSADPAGLVQARRAADQVLCLPIFPDLTDEEVREVAGQVIAAIT